MTDETEGRRRVAEAIQDYGPGHLQGEDDDDRAILLTGFCIIAEWIDEQGHKWLSKVCCDASGEPLTSWTMNGMLHEGLHTRWPGDGEDDE